MSRPPEKKVLGPPVSHPFSAPFLPLALSGSFFSYPLLSTTQPLSSCPESPFRAADGRCMTCFFLRVHGKLGYGITAPHPQPSRLLGPWSWCSAPFLHVCMITLLLTRSLGRWEKRGWDQGGPREPEGGETADIRSIQKWKEGEPGGRRRVSAGEKEGGGKVIVSENRRKSPETPGEETGGGRGGRRERGNREGRGWEEKLNVLRCCSHQ